MPPRKRAEATPARPAARAKQPANDGLCPEHWPLGWETVPAEHEGVGCEHGSWTRPADDEGED